MAARSTIIESIKLDDIFLAGERRPVSVEAVTALAASIGDIGLQHPITVRHVERHIDPAEGELDGAFVLVAGRHRLEAARSLGFACIDCVVTRWDDRQARKWEIAENLHRADLTDLQRKEQIAEWIALTDAEEKLAQVEPVSVGGRGREGGVRAAARDLGIERNEAQRAVKIASISDRAKQAAIDAHLDNNQSALLKVAAAQPAEQVEKVRELAAARDARRAQRTAVTVPLAAAPLDEADTREKWIARGMSWWNNAPQEWRDEFLGRVELASRPASSNTRSRSSTAATAPSASARRSGSRPRALPGWRRTSCGPD